MSWAEETTETFGEKQIQQFSLSFRSWGGQVTTETSHYVANTSRNEFLVSEENTRSFQFDKPGVVWQWEFKSGGLCGHSTTKTDHLMLTNGGEIPCCLPTLFADFNDPTGACVPPPRSSDAPVNLC